MPPLNVLAKTCGMEFAGYVYSGELSYQNRHNKEKLALNEAKGGDACKRLNELLSKI